MYHPSNSSTTFAHQAKVSKPEPYLFYPLNASYIAGKVRYPAVREGPTLVFSIVIIVVMSVFVAFMMPNAYTQANFANNGKLTTGTITHLNIDTNGTYDVTF